MKEDNKIVLKDIFIVLIYENLDGSMIENNY